MTAVFEKPTAKNHTKQRIPENISCKMRNETKIPILTTIAFKHHPGQSGKRRE